MQILRRKGEYTSRVRAALAKGKTNMNSRELQLLMALESHRLGDGGTQKQVTTAEATSSFLTCFRAPIAASPALPHPPLPCLCFFRNGSESLWSQLPWHCQQPAVVSVLREGRLTGHSFFSGIHVALLLAVKRLVQGHTRATNTEPCQP